MALLFRQSRCMEARGSESQFGLPMVTSLHIKRRKGVHPVAAWQLGNGSSTDYSTAFGQSGRAAKVVCSGNSCIVNPMNSAVVLGRCLDQGCFLVKPGLRLIGQYQALRHA